MFRRFMFASLLGFSLVSAAFLGCRRRAETPSETAGRVIENTGEKVGNGLKKAGDKIEEGTDKVGDKLKN